MTIRRVALVVHTGKPHADRIQNEIQSYLEAHDVSVGDSAPDLVVSLGGDGTMLRAAQLAHASDALLLGVNMGTLGYLTETDAVDALPALGKVLSGDHSVEQRMMLAADVHRPDGVVSHVGLNEVLVERSARHRLVRLSVTIGGESLAAFNADGIIVSTPTGSTAYALSAGGPIVSPRAECLIVVPVSAHMIFARPFVLAADETVEIHLEGHATSAEVTLDGAMSTPIEAGSFTRVRRHERNLKLVRLSGPNFLPRLRTKLGLPG
jgi:NAD+ kinase